VRNATWALCRGRNFGGKVPPVFFNTAASSSSKRGNVVAEFECGGLAESGVIRMRIHGESLTFDEQDKDPRGAPLRPIHQDNSNFSTSYEFKDVNYVTGGRYTAVAQDDPHGTCMIEMQ
jgi:hypothetical protein